VEVKLHSLLLPKYMHVSVHVNCSVAWPWWRALRLHDGSGLSQWRRNKIPDPAENWTLAGVC